MVWGNRIIVLGRGAAIFTCESRSPRAMTRCRFTQTKLDPVVTPAVATELGKRRATRCHVMSCPLMLRYEGLFFSLCHHIAVSLCSQRLPSKTH